MVNSIGLLEDGDLLVSSLGRPRFDKDWSSETESDPDRDGDGEDSDEDDAEEVGPTYREGSHNPLDISITGLN